jgi:endonuclease/exonuclease/phosphatase (EEP) superfamily protein YafD
VVKAASIAARQARYPEWLAVALGIAYALARFPSPFALFDNLSNFPFHFAVAFIAIAAAFALRGRRWSALAAAACALLPISQVAPWYLGAETAASDEARPAVKLLVSNVYYGNRERSRILQLVASENPDVVGLIEIDAAWLASLGELRARYPYYYEVPDQRFVGLGLYSRSPLVNARTLRLPNSGMPSVAATLRTPGGDVEILLVHVNSPVEPELIRRRNEQISQLATYVRESGKPTVVAGDLNLTMWNRGYRPLEEIAGLHNARAGHGAGPTWPAIGRLGVPIDHILATPDVGLRNFRVLRNIGSDHRPIVAEFAPRQPRLALRRPGMHAQSAQVAPGAT